MNKIDVFFKSLKAIDSSFSVELLVLSPREVFLTVKSIKNPPMFSSDAFMVSLFDPPLLGTGSFSRHFLSSKYKAGPQRAWGLGWRKEWQCWSFLRAGLSRLGQKSQPAPPTSLPPPRVDTEDPELKGTQPCPGDLPVWRVRQAPGHERIQIQEAKGRGGGGGILMGGGRYFECSRK